MRAGGLYRRKAAELIWRVGVFFSASAAFLAPPGFLTLRVGMIAKQYCSRHLMTNREEGATAARRSDRRHRRRTEFFTQPSACRIERAAPVPPRAVAGPSCNVEGNVTCCFQPTCAALAAG